MDHVKLNCEGLVVEIEIFQISSKRNWFSRYMGVKFSPKPQTHYLRAPVFLAACLAIILFFAL